MNESFEHISTMLYGVCLLVWAFAIYGFWHFIEVLVRLVRRTVASATVRRLNDSN